MKVKATTIMFGSNVDYPVINSLVKILNERHNDNTRKYCVTTIQEFREIISKVTSLDKVTRKYLLYLIKMDFKDRLHSVKIEDNLRTHILNLIFGIHNSELIKI